MVNEERQGSGELARQAISLAVWLGKSTPERVKSTCLHAERDGGNHQRNREEKEKEQERGRDPDTQLQGCWDTAAPMWGSRSGRAT